jgi:hypothetical protein
LHDDVHGASSPLSGPSSHSSPTSTDPSPQLGGGTSVVDIGTSVVDIDPVVVPSVSLVGPVVGGIVVELVGGGPLVGPTVVVASVPALPVEPSLAPAVGSTNFGFVSRQPIAAAPAAAATILQIRPALAISTCVVEAERPGNRRRPRALAPHRSLISRIAPAL